jgi:co-chaperonin GroES (HSP10)
MRLTPLPKHIFVVPRKQKKESAGGIVLQSNETLDSPVGIVVEVGESVSDVKFGDKVYIDWSKGRQAKSEQYEGVMIEEKHVLATLDE